MDVNTLINSRDKFTREQLEYLLHKTDNQADYLLLNYLEQRVIEIHGKDFVKNSTNKIQYIMGIALQNDIEEYDKFYSGCFEMYMQACGRNIKAIPGFNLIFITLTHIAIKILRKNKESK